MFLSLSRAAFNRPIAIRPLGEVAEVLLDMALDHEAEGRHDLAAECLAEAVRLENS